MTTNLEHFEAKKQITAKRSRPKLVKKQQFENILRLKNK